MKKSILVILILPVGNVGIVCEFSKNYIKVLVACNHFQRYHVTL